MQEESVFIISIYESNSSVIDVFAFLVHIFILKHESSFPLEIGPKNKLNSDELSNFFYYCWLFLSLNVIVKNKVKVLNLTIEEKVPNLSWFLTQRKNLLFCLPKCAMFQIHCKKKKKLYRHFYFLYIIWIKVGTLLNGYFFQAMKTKDFSALRLLNSVSVTWGVLLPPKKIFKYS